MTQAKQIFEVLMRENAEMLLAYLRSTVRDRNTVDDIFQETMVIAWKRIADFDQELSFGKWLRGIARNLVLTHFRKAGKSPQTLDEAALDWIEGKFAQLQHQRGDTLSDKLSLLRNCVEALPEDNRKTIEARYLQQISLDEIGSMLGVTVETIKKRLYRAKAQLAACLEKKLLAMEDM